MAKNAAELLLELFDKWFAEGTNPTRAGLRSSDEDEWLVETRLAVRYMEELELWLAREGQESAEMKRVVKYFPKYWDWIFARSYGWSGDSSRVKNYISQAEIDALDGLASKPINNFGDLPASNVDSVRCILPNLIDEVDQDNDLPGPMKQYVKTVLAHAYEILSVADRSSAFDQQNALSNLVSALNLAGLQVKDEQRKKRLQTAASLVFTVLATSFFTAVGEGVYSVLVGPSAQKLQELTAEILELEGDVVDAEIVQDEESPIVETGS